MTRKQWELRRLAGKYRGWAGQLRFTDKRRVDNKKIQEHIDAAHDSLCKAFMLMEEQLEKENV